jgi:hypothetical protein
MALTIRRPTNQPRGIVSLSCLALCRYIKKAYYLDRADYTATIHALILDDPDPHVGDR